MPGMNLTKPEAAERAALVSAVRYDIAWDFTAPGATFVASTTVTFDAVPGCATGTPPHPP